MPATSDAPFYRQGEHPTNNAAFQISQLVRSGADARRLLVPVHDWADLSGRPEAAAELEAILSTWDDGSFGPRAGRARQILEELDLLWSDQGGVDMMDLGERRVPLYALANAIDRREQEVRQG